MTTQVLEEKPSTQTTSEAENVAASEGNRVDPESTAGNEEVQQNSEQENDSQESEQSSHPDTRQARLQALADAEREEAKEQGKAEALAELQGNTQAQQREQQRQRVRQAHVNTLAKVDEIVAKAVDEYGQPRPLTLAETAQIKAAQNEYHKVALDVAEDEVAERVQARAYAILPKAAQEAFDKSVSGEDIDLETYLNNWVETAALYTKAVKSMALEDAVKASPKIKREVEQAKLVAYDEGREQGRLDPPGTSPDAGKTGQRSAPSSKTYIELETKYGNGTATKAEAAEYVRLRDQRAKSR